MNSCNCIICGSNLLVKCQTAFAPFLVDRMFDGQKIATDIIYCESCGFCYSGYRPTKEEMSKLYNGYRNNDYQKQRNIYEKNYTESYNYSLGHDSKEMDYRKQSLYNILKDNIDVSEIKNILDFGGDEGQFIPDQLNHTQRYVYDVSGVSTVNEIKKISDETELIKHRYDLVMCCHVLEHVSYPIEIINGLINLLEDNKYLYLEVPYEKYLMPKTINGLKCYLNTPKIHEHINSFREETFKEIFKDKKFSIIYLQTDKTIKCLVQKKSKGN